MSVDVQSLAKRRGFIWQSSEIYGSLAGFYDYGAMGAALKRRWEDAWLDFFLGLDDNYHLIDSANILPEAALKASGHLDGFTDPLVECTKCGNELRADQLIEEKVGGTAEDLEPGEIDKVISEHGLVCPKCKGKLGKARVFNMMFPVNVGTKGTDTAYLRPETAQGAYLNFKRHFEILRRKLPMGLAIIGKAYRNEIAPRQGVYRMRELIQAELQIFFDPETWDDVLDYEDMWSQSLNVQLASRRDKGDFETLTCKELVDKHDVPAFFAYHMLKIQEFYMEKVHVPSEKFRFYEKAGKEKAFYNRVHFDIEVDLETLGGFKELAGIHYRGDYDLARHQEHSKERMEVSVDGRKFVPHVLELSFGVDRNFWALLDLHFADERTGILKLPPALAPYTFAVFPLMKKEELMIEAERIRRTLRERFDIVFDTSGSIGKRYARMDEIGTPFCITIDYDTPEKGTVTLRDRDSTEQKLIGVDELVDVCTGLKMGSVKFSDLK